MDARKSLEAQLQVRHNAEEIKNSLSGLYNWTKDIKTQDKELRTGPLPEKLSDAPVRSQVQQESPAPDNKQAELAKNIKNLQSKGEQMVPNSTESKSPVNVVPQPLQETHQRANERKDRGNSLVKIGDHTKAIDEYTKAIDTFPTDPIYYTNRALCYLKLELYKECIKDCGHAIRLDKSTVKAYYRRMQAHESLGNNVEALQDCTTLLAIDPKNAEGRRSLERINKRIREQSLPHGPKFTPLRSNMLDILPIDKPPYRRSKKPLKRVQVTDVVGSKETKNFENQQLDISDEVIDKLFNSNCGPFVEIKKSDKPASPTQPIALAPNTAVTETVQKSKAEPSNKSETKPSNAPTQLEKKSSNVVPASTPAASTPPPEKPKAEECTKEEQEAAPENEEKPLPEAPKTPAQFYAAWKELSPKQKFLYLKSIELANIRKVTGAGFDSETLTDILHIMRDHFLPNHETGTAEILYQLSTNEQIGILSLLMSKDDQEILKHILTLLKAEGETAATFSQKIAENFHLM